LIRVGGHARVASGPYIGQFTFLGLGHRVLTVVGTALSMA
jgi:hypothetical protein